MEANQVGLEQAFEKFLPLVKGVEDCRGWEGLVEIEANIRSN